MLAGLALGKCGHTVCEVMAMPYKPKLIYWQKIIALLNYSFSFNPKPVLGGVALMLLASLLLLTVFGSIRSGSIALTVPEVSKQAELKRTVELNTMENAAATPVIGKQEALPPETAKPAAAVWPINGKIVKDVGWYENLALKEWRYHGGYDLEGKSGQEVVAMLDGEVTDVYNIASSGLTVVIKHGEYVVQYGSLASAAVKKGDSVKGGSKVGIIGTFPAESFLHLHLVIKKGDKLVAPQELLN